MKRTIHLVLALCSFGTVIAQPTMEEQRAFTREAAELYALENGYSMRYNELEISRAKAVIWENVALGLPNVNIDANLINNLEIGGQVVEFGGQTQFLQFGVQYSSVAGVTVDQLIFDGSYIVALVATEVVRQNAENDYEKSAIDTRAEVAEAYNGVLVTERSLEIVQENITFIEKSLADTRGLFEAGFVEQSDVDQLDLLLTNLRANEDYLQRQVVVVRSILKLRMGIPVNETITLTDDIEALLFIASDGSNLLNEAFDPTEHIDYRTLQTGIRGQELSLRNEQVQWLPKLSAFYRYNYNFQSPDFGELYAPNDITSFGFPASNIGLSLRWNIFQGSGRIAKVQEAQVALEQLRVQEEQLSDGLRLDFQLAQAEYAYAVNNYLAQRQNAQIAKDIRDRTAIKFGEGVASSLEFTTAERQYQEALRNAISVGQDALNKRVALEKVLGKFNLNQSTTNTTQQ